MAKILKHRSSSIADQLRATREASQRRVPHTMERQRREWQSLAFGEVEVRIRHSIRNTATREGTRGRYTGKLLHEDFGLFDGYELRDGHMGGKWMVSH
jgi:hypothetical protein